MLRRVLGRGRVIKETLVVIDSRFPRAEPFGFRNTEINQYFKRIPGFKSYTMSPMLPGEKAWFKHGYGVDRRTFMENKKGYLKYYPENKYRIKYLEQDKRYNIKLAYSFFLAETYTLLPFYEENCINFVFVLFPGGAFGLDNTSSDAMLGEIFASRYFKKVIVTKNITYDYLLRKNLCKPDKITKMRGFVQFGQDQIRKKKKYKTDKDTFDICFVAAKYSNNGRDKGYDVFIDIAKVLSGSYMDIRFHVIGNFNEDDVDIEEIKDRITFYGFRRPDFLNDLYPGMDILVSPNRALQLYRGNFDGFPLGADAGYMGVALFVTDELGQNEYFKEDEEIIIIKPEVKSTVKKITHYYHHLDELYHLSREGQKVMMKTFDNNEQCEIRIDLFNEILRSIG